MLGYAYEVDLHYTVVEDANHKATFNKLYGYQNLAEALTRGMRCMKECEKIADDGEGTEFSITIWECGDNFKILADFASVDGYLWA